MDEFLANPPQTTMITGARGAGKSFLATWLSAKLLDVFVEQLDKNAYFYLMSSGGLAISIDAVRDLTQFLKLKVPGKSGVARVVLINDAENLTIEAQNALLKLLEEPPKHTVIILTSSNPQKLLSTIRSRVQEIPVKPVNKQVLLDHFLHQGHDTEPAQRAIAISEGSIGLAQALLASDSDHPLVQQITRAKQALSSTAFERMCLVDELSKEAENVPLFLTGLERVVHAALRQSIKNKTPSDKLHGLLKRLAEARDSIELHPNNKLMLTDLFLNM